jgi:lipopolysaccharide transport system permease protein
MPSSGAAWGNALMRLLRVFDPVRVASATLDGTRLLLRHHRLALAMAHRELTSRYAGQALGAFWVVGHPLFQMLIFLLIFAVVFSVKIEQSVEMPRDYTVYILSGLVPWLSILPVLTASPLSIVSNSTLVKQFTFEIEVLPIKDVIITMVFWSVGIVIVIAYTLFAFHALPWTYLLLPLLLVLHVATMVGFAWLLSAISVFFRDLKDIITVLANMGVYILPVVYLPQWVPPAFKPFVYGNPLSSIIWMYQDVLYFGGIAHPFAWVVGILLALVAFSGGHRIFQRLRPMFGSAL